MAEKQPENLFFFYEDLIRNGLNSLQEEFVGFSQVIESGTGKDKKSERVVIEGVTQLNWQSYLKSASKNQSRRVLLSAESNLMAAPLSDTKVLIAKYLSDLDYYVNRLGKLEILSKHLFFIKDLDEIKVESAEKLKYFYLLAESEKSELNEESKQIYREGSDSRENSSVTYKIKWKAKVNILATLFYDMMVGQDGNPPIIEASSKVVKDFLLNNFIDADGNSLSKSTIETYFSTEKIEKRAKRKSRIEIKNVTLKYKPL